MALLSYLRNIFYNLHIILLYTAYLQDFNVSSNINWGCHGCDRMVVGFITTCAICAYPH